jgi:C-terminal processing protease CtpA/Prc
MFVIRTEVDWMQFRDNYRPLARKCKSVHEIAVLCAEMLKPLRDLHVWIHVSGEKIPVFDRPYQTNANSCAYRRIIGDLDQKNGLIWGITPNEIGFVSILLWNGDTLPSDFDEALEKMRNTHSLIVDTRLNYGGNEDLATQVESRFLEKEFTYGFCQFRNGPDHDNLSDRIERKIKPRGLWRYEKPVILLIGQKCVSSNESFIAMMAGAPNVTTMGDRTRGSSGNPTIINLPLDITVSVPQWIDYLPDGSLLDEHGIEPQISFTLSPVAFEGDRDDLLTAAIERLSNPSLPLADIADDSADAL